MAIVSILFGACSKDVIYFPDSVQTEAEKAIEYGFDGIIVYVNAPGRTSFYSAGWNNREKQIPIDPNDLFKIASISKLYIAATVAKLVAQDSLSLDQTLSELIPEVKGKIENADKITLKLMVQHRSGIPEYIYEPDFDSGTEDSYLTTAALIFGKPADFEPDDKYAYSNTNYLLIGEILDRTLGYSHHEFVTNNLLVPLGLTNTFNLYSEVDSNDAVSGYYKGYDHSLKPVDHTGPGGSMVATAEDVGLFLRALIDGTLLTAEEQTIYTSIYEYEHTGWLPGYCSIARYHSDLDAVVVQFVNTSGTEFFWLDLERVYNRILTALEKEEFNN
ncbi:MAG: serine hydrolase domain-containing protein [Salibacteraceae bacterium]